MIALWKQHGTKILGYISALPAATGAYLAYLSANPASPTLIPHKYFVPICLFNLLLAPLIVKRGHTNTAAQNGSGN